MLIVLFSFDVARARPGYIATGATREGVEVGGEETDEMEEEEEEADEEREGEGEGGREGEVGGERDKLGLGEGSIEKG